MPPAWLRRQADRAAQADWNQPQGHAAILAQMAAVVRGEATPMVTGREARRSHFRKADGSCSASRANRVDYIDLSVLRTEEILRARY